jgi:hypothetical protein
VGEVEFKPRDLGSAGTGWIDATVVVVVSWVGWNLNPHPLKAEGAAPKSRLVGGFELVEAMLELPLLGGFFAGAQEVGARLRWLVGA